MIRRLSKLRAFLALAAIATAPDVAAQKAIPAQFQGKWVPVKAACESGLGATFSADRVTLFNGKDTEAIGGVEMAGPGYFPPGYRTIQVVAIAEFSGQQPVTAFFNANEKKGAAYVEYSPVMPGNQTAQSKAYNARISKLNLAKRFPLNKVPLKKCAK
jgi:hypothetical protein